MIRVGDATQVADYEVKGKQSEIWDQELQTGMDFDNDDKLGALSPAKCGFQKKTSSRAVSLRAVLW